MLSIWQSIGVRKFWPPSLRREHNDLVGWQISVLGTTYTVIIGFMLWNVWNNFPIRAN